MLLDGILWLVSPWMTLFSFLGSGSAFAADPHPHMCLLAIACLHLISQGFLKEGIGVLWFIGCPARASFIVNCYNHEDPAWPSSFM